MNARTRKARAILRRRQAANWRVRWIEQHRRTCTRGSSCVALAFMRLAMVHGDD